MKGLNLFNCKGVTDEGIKELAKIPTLEWLALEGTSITDRSLEIIASEMNLTSVAVNNCPGVTYEGLKVLATSESLWRVSFSAGRLTQEQREELLKLFDENHIGYTMRGNL